MQNSYSLKQKLLESSWSIKKLWFGGEIRLTKRKGEKIDMKLEQKSRFQNEEIRIYGKLF